MLSDDKKVSLHSKYLLSKFREPDKTSFVLSNKNIHYVALKSFMNRKLFRLRSALNVSDTFMSRNYFASKT